MRCKAPKPPPCMLSQSSISTQGARRVLSETASSAVPRARRDASLRQWRRRVVFVPSRRAADSDVVCPSRAERIGHAMSRISRQPIQQPHPPDREKTVGLEAIANFDLAADMCRHLVRVRERTARRNPAPSDWAASIKWTRPFSPASDCQIHACLPPSLKKTAIVLPELTRSRLVNFDLCFEFSTGCRVSTWTCKPPPPPRHKTQLQVSFGEPICLAASQSGARCVGDPEYPLSCGLIWVAQP